MTYEQRLYNLIEEIKADKSFPNPWRNYVGSDGVRLQALIRMGESTTLREVPEGYQAEVRKAVKQPILGSDTQSDFSKTLSEQVCICVPGGAKQTCPVHGGWK